MTYLKLKNKTFLRKKSRLALLFPFYSYRTTPLSVKCSRVFQNLLLLKKNLTSVWNFFSSKAYFCTKSFYSYYILDRFQGRYYFCLKVDHFQNREMDSGPGMASTFCTCSHLYHILITRDSVSFNSAVYHIF